MTGPELETAFNNGMLKTQKQPTSLVYLRPVTLHAGPLMIRRWGDLLHPLSSDRLQKNADAF